MDASQDRTAESLRVAEIRREIEAIRLRIASTIDALEYKADVPSRLGEAVSSTASSVTAKVKERVASVKAARQQPGIDESSNDRILD
jgi:Protein of unknown function (DUF3618)